MRFPHGTILLLGLVTIASYGAWYYSFGVLLEPIQTETGWSEGAITAAFGLSSALGAVASVPAGRLVDRFGSRPGFLAAAALSSAGLGLASVAGSLPLFVVGAVSGGSSLQALAFYHITQTTAVRVAPDQPARAISLLTVYGAFSSTIFLPLAALLVTTTGWRTTLRILTFATAAVLLAGAALVRERTTPDRRRARLDLRRAFADAPARRFLVASALIGFCVGVVLVYQVPLMTGAGLSIGTASWMAGARGIAQLSGRLPLPLLLRRLGTRQSVRVAFGAIALGTLILAAAGNLVVALGYVAIAGFGIGATSPLQGIYANELFDSGELGATLGVVTMVFGLCSAVGPTIVGISADVTGTRWWGLGATLVAGAAAVALMGRVDEENPIGVSL